MGRTAKGPYWDKVLNHKSAQEFPEAIEEYIENELECWAILDPFASLPVVGCHVSPLMTRPKDGDKRGVIVDLSYGDQASVNGSTAKTSYDGAPFSLTLPNLNYLIHHIIHSKGNPKIMKTDIARAFRNVRVDPADALKLVIQHGGKFYVDKSLAFGVVHGTAIFQRISDAIRAFLKMEGIMVWNYIGDIFACAEESEEERVFNQLYQLIQALGLPINTGKVVKNTDVMTCMGIEVGQN